MAKNINIKLDEQKDKVLIDFLEDKPHTYILKEALKMYITAYENMQAPK